MKNIPAPVRSVFAIVIINVTAFLLFQFLLMGHLVHNGMMGFPANNPWAIGWMDFVNRLYYGSLAFLTLLNILWVCILPYNRDKITHNRSSARGWYWIGLIINAIIGFLTTPFLVWLPFGMDIGFFLILFALTILVSVGTFIIASLCVDENIRNWWKP